MSDHCKHGRDVTGGPYAVPNWDLWFPSQTPVIPELYWAVPSQGARYELLCCTLHQLIDYSKLLADALNTVTDEVRKEPEAQKQWVDDKIRTMYDELKKLIEQVSGTSMDWDVTRGELTSTMVAHRRLYWWLTPHGLVIADFNAAMPDLTVEELAESGLNCQGWAQYGDDYVKSGIKAVPAYYRYNR